MKPYEKITITVTYVLVLVIFLAILFHSMGSFYTYSCCFLLALIFRWAQDVYEFTESGKATVELVTDTKLEETQVAIQGFPRQIPEGHPNRLPNLVVPGLAFPGEN